jgi:hypothetical protein
MLIMVLVSFLVAGCGSSRVKVSGRLTKGGVPYVPGNNEMVRLVFSPLDPQASESRGSYLANFNREDGTFKVVGTDGKGIPPGQYRIAIRVLKNRKDLLKGAFEAKKSPFVREVTSSTKEISLDLANPKE